MRIGEWAAEFKTKYLSLWWETEEEFSLSINRSSRRDKRKREKGFDVFHEDMLDRFNHIPEEEHLRIRWQEELMSHTREYGKDLLFMPESCLNILSHPGFRETTRHFVQQVRAYDPAVQIQDIFQAIRNVWIVNTIQLLLHKPVECSPSIFAYSMLYPYTDNYLDNPDVPHEMKMNFNGKFELRLSGEVVRWANEDEQNIFQMVKIIEEQYPRPQYPQVYESLMAIHKAQQKSLIQQTGSLAPYERDILGISLEKGGTSVLADGCLVTGSLDKKTADFLFGFGCFLQLLDDLQDARTDAGNQHMTIFSQAAGKWKLDSLTAHVINFMRRVLDEAECLSSQEQAPLRELIYTNCIFLALMAVAKDKKLFSRRFYRSAQEYWVFRFSYTRKVKSQLEKKYKKIRDVNKVVEALSI